MGGDPYWYYARHQTDVETTLQSLRRQEFEAGRYRPAASFLSFPITDDTPAPGSQHSSIEEAIEATDASGTGSILDMFKAATVSYDEALDASEQDGVDLFCTTFPISSDELIRLFGTEQPTRQMIESVIILSQENEEAADEFWDSIDRGTGRHIIVYEDNEPTEVFFIGYSFD
jgi:hypothetical protein